MTFFWGSGRGHSCWVKVKEVFLEGPHLPPAVAHIYISSVQVSFVLEKVEEGPYWDRLLDSKLKQHWLKIDYKNWVDEDEEEEPGQGQDLGE